MSSPPQVQIEISRAKGVVAICVGEGCTEFTIDPMDPKEPRLIANMAVELAIAQGLVTTRSKIDILDIDRDLVMRYRHSAKAEQAQEMKAITELRAKGAPFTKALLLISPRDRQGGISLHIPTESIEFKVYDADGVGEIAMCILLAALWDGLVDFKSEITILDTDSEQHV